jgi:hypothetical protein
MHHYNCFYEDKLTKEDMNTKFLGLEIDKHIDWKIHIMHTLLQLGSAYYTDICCILVMLQLWSCIFSIALWGNSMDIYKVFRLLKQAIWIMMGINSRSSGRTIFKTLKTLTVPSQYILSLMTFLAYNLEYLTFINTLHSKYAWRGLHLHLPWGNLTYHKRCSLCVY